MKKILLGIVIAVIVVSAAIGTAAQKTTVPQLAPTVQPTPTVAAPAALATAPVVAAPTTVTIATLRGTNNKSGKSFTLAGNDTLAYTVTNTSSFGMGVAAIYVMAVGTSLATDGGIPVVMLTKPGSDTTQLNLPAGDYYLVVNTANVSWSVTITEDR